MNFTTPLPHHAEILLRENQERDMAFEGSWKFSLTLAQLHIGGHQPVQPGLVQNPHCQNSIVPGELFPEH